MIKGIVCVAKDWGIGKQNGLLFDIPADMKHFREETMGKICVFGYNTYMSLPKRPLKNRVNIVLWDKAESMDCLEGAITFSDFNQLVKFVNILASQYDVYICGGAGVYAAFVPYYDLVDVTFVDAIDPETTAFFPDLKANGFEKVYNEPYHIIEGAGGTNGYAISKQLWSKHIKMNEVEADYGR